MSLLNATETELVNEMLDKTQKRFQSAQVKLAMMVSNNGPAYAVKWAGDALEAEARFKALSEVHSFYTIDLADFGTSIEARTAADRASSQRALEKLRYICNGTSSETEQVREAQAYAWAHGEYMEALRWSARLANRAEQVQA